MQTDLDAWIDSYNYERAPRTDVLRANADGDVRGWQTNQSGKVSKPELAKKYRRTA
jgi:hypothetical protein